ncbi:MAG: metal-dependent transcriptional regulator [Verrucomicrobiae bacterium]|nr:metal-dependent transcriptional regulator [Verrucomicrobiae bacterium]
MTWFLAGMAILLAATVLWPRRGLLARWREGRALAQRTRREDALKHILKCEANQQTPSIQSVAGALGVSSDRAADVLHDLESRGLISHQQGRLHLQPAGRELATHVVRAHRLWESFLAEQTGVADAQWHARAERQEHLLTPQQTDELAARLGHPTRDPHGDRIPAAGEDIGSDAGQPLNSAPLNAPLVITHIEDEPQAVYAQLSAQGLRSGMKACLLERTPDQLRLWAEGRDHTLTPLQANNIAVVPLAGTRTTDLFQEEYLHQLRPGERAEVLGLSAACRGPERRRLLDLGFVPGTVVEVERVSPLGDPVAYRVRGSVVALRSEQARLIRIRRCRSESVAA